MVPRTPDQEYRYIQREMAANAISGFDHRNMIGLLIGGQDRSRHNATTNQRGRLCDPANAKSPGSDAGAKSRNNRDRVIANYAATNQTHLM
jgi:hypothetical protein